jgi:hypothetical protein
MQRFDFLADFFIVFIVFIFIGPRVPGDITVVWCEDIKPSDIACFAKYSVALANLAKITVKGATTGKYQVVVRYYAVWDNNRLKLSILEV